MVDLLLMYNGNALLLPILLQQIGGTHNNTKIGRKVCVLDEAWESEGVKDLLREHSIGICVVDFYNEIDSGNFHLDFESWKAKVIDKFLRSDLLGDNMLFLSSNVIPKSEHWLDIMWGHYADEGICFFRNFLKRTYEVKKQYTDEDYKVQFFPNSDVFIINKKHYINCASNSFIMPNVKKDNIKPVYGADYSAQYDGSMFHYGVLGKYVSDSLGHMHPYINGEYLFKQLFDNIKPFAVGGKQVVYDLSGNMLYVRKLMRDYINILSKYNFSLEFYEENDYPSFYKGFHDYYLDLFGDTILVLLKTDNTFINGSDLSMLFFDFYTDNDADNEPDYVLLSSAYTQIEFDDFIDLFIDALFDGVAYKHKSLGTIVLMKQSFVEDSGKTHESLFEENALMRKLLPERL